MAMVNPALMPSMPVLIFGGSGEGKSTSISGFQPPEVGVIAAEKVRLPFKSDIKVARIPEFLDARTMAQKHAAQYSWIINTIRAAKCKSIVIDDSQYLMVNELFDRAMEKGYDKYTEMAMNFRNLVHAVNSMTEPNKIVYFLHHAEFDADGKARAKTIGKMLDEKLVLEGLFDVVIYCKDKKFYTQGNGTSTAKTPMGMFDQVEIPNDLKLVDTAIRQYYG